jgi:CBS domain-containing protein
MQVEDVMNHEAEVIRPSSSIRDAARTMRAKDIGALPVSENGRLVGMVTDRDIAVRAVAENRPAGGTVVRQVMSGDVYCCFEDDDLERAAQLMAEHQVRRLPVLNHDDRLVGMITLADLGRSSTEAGGKALEGISQPTDQTRR